MVNVFLLHTVAPNRTKRRGIGSLLCVCLDDEITTSWSDFPVERLAHRTYAKALSKESRHEEFEHGIK